MGEIVNGSQNTLLDLSDTLFEQLERINDASAEELEDEIRRSKAMCGIAGTIIGNASTVVDAMKFRDSAMDAGTHLPRMLTGGE